MHLGNAAITPECAAITFGAAAAGLGVAAFAARREPISQQKLALAAAMGSLVFAAQAINVPVLPGASAHLVGGVLLAWALGPGWGAWIMAIVLAIQALVLGDGGVAALGANVLNMALLPAGLVAVCKQSKVAESRSWWTKPSLLASTSVPLAAVLIVGQVALFRSPPELAGWSDFAMRMIGMHLLIGLAEGGLTVALLVAISRLSEAESKQPTWRPIGVAICLAALLGIGSVWSSAHPDAYEAAARQSGMGWVLGDEAG